MKISSEEISTYLNLLEEAPGRIKTAVADSSPAQLYARSDEEPWSVNDVLAHLRACAEVWGKSVQRMIDKDHPKIRYLSPRTWIKKTDYLEQEFNTAFQAFTQQRLELLQTLKTLKPDDWARSATFTGTTLRTQTIMDHVQRLALHELGHCEQIEELMKIESIS